MAVSNTELIKEKLDIAEFLKGYLTLTPAGRNFKALCPFHNEKTPSFMISPERQTWHCFGCGLGGDIFAFLMRYENLEFMEALRALAEKAGVELSFSSSPDYKFSGLLYELNNAALNFFVDQLAASDEARAYLAARGLTRETIAEFELGWAPVGSEALNLHLLKAGYAPEDIMRAGLTIKTNRGMTLDRFRGRIMFPIHSSTGKTVGFTGRILPRLDDGTSGKYVNSPETPVFVKSKVFYGLSKSKNHIREARNAFLVEGQMDLLMSWQAGVKNVVATSGTALSDDHVRTLRRLAESITVSFDNDEAGWAAGERVVDFLQANDFTVKTLVLHGVKDPAEAIQKDPAAFCTALAAARPAFEFYYDRYFKDMGQARDASFKAALRAVLGKVTAIQSPVEQSMWLRELARRVDIDEQALREEAWKYAHAALTPRMVKEETEGAVKEEAASRHELLSRHLVAACVAHEDFAAAKESLPYLTDDYRNIYEALRSGAKSIADPRLDALMNIVLLASGDLKSENIGNIQALLVEEFARGRRRELTRKLRNAEATGDEAGAEQVLKEFGKLSA